MILLSLFFVNRILSIVTQVFRMIKNMKVIIILLTRLLFIFFHFFFKEDKRDVSKG